MKKSVILSLTLISALGLNSTNANALSMFDFKACELHGIEYTLVLNHEVCPLVPEHEALILEGMSSSENKTINSNIGFSITNIFNTNSQSTNKTIMESPEVMDSIAETNENDGSVNGSGIDLYEIIIHSSHCYSSHPGNM